jgi:hypothetical protein
MAAITNGSVFSCPSPAIEGQAYSARITSVNYADLILNDIVYTAMPELTKYSVTVTESENGSASVVPGGAEEGQSVTVFPVPDSGFETDTVTVTARSGNSVEATRNSAGTYTFFMPP